MKTKKLGPEFWEERLFPPSSIFLKKIQKGRGRGRPRVCGVDVGMTLGTFYYFTIFTLFVYFSFSKV